MANVATCPALINVCAVRVTRLSSLGVPLTGPNTSYVTGNTMMLSAKPVIEAGVDKPLVGGCDCIIAFYHGYDKLKYFNLEFDDGLVEPGLIEMMTGAPAILDPITSVPIGWNWPNQLDCSQPTQPNVAIEVWQEMWVDDHQNTQYPYFRYIWPSSYWQMSDFTAQQDFNSPKITAWTRTNPNWGLGPYGDQPEAINSTGGGFFDTFIPTAECGYLSVPVT
jgi:hypothetical protein